MAEARQMLHSKRWLRREALNGLADLIEGQVLQGWAEFWSDGTSPTAAEMDYVCNLIWAEIKRIEKRIPQESPNAN